MSTGGSVGVLEPLRQIDERVRARRPREVVDVLSLVAMRRRAVGVVGARGLLTPEAPTTKPRGT